MWFEKLQPLDRLLNSLTIHFLSSALLLTFQSRLVEYRRSHTVQYTGRFCNWLIMSQSCPATTARFWLNIGMPVARGGVFAQRAWYGAVPRHGGCHAIAAQWLHPQSNKQWRYKVYYSLSLYSTSLLVLFNGKNTWNVLCICQLYFIDTVSLVVG